MSEVLHNNNRRVNNNYLWSFRVKEVILQTLWPRRGKGIFVKIIKRGGAIDIWTRRRHLRSCCDVLRQKIGERCRDEFLSVFNDDHWETMKKPETKNHFQKFWLLKSSQFENVWETASFNMGPLVPIPSRVWLFSPPPDTISDLFPVRPRILYVFRCILAS